ncbi:uncharacterized protein G2W53_043407 [Senna tora]|uniref:Uncharacterized protein n=1 Tax=Senna tora TaxID=362788 RepID=A0A834SIU5_9FABA|nr:uncharacterized protein G2W53_043407 [Senna tora]
MATPFSSDSDDLRSPLVSSSWVMDSWVQAEFDQFIEHLVHQKEE